MLNWKNVIGLSAGDEEIAGKVEAFIDTQVAEQSAGDEKRRSFNVPRAEIVKASGVDVLTLKVKTAVLDKYRKDGGWEVTENDTDIVLTAPLPKKRGGRPKGSKNAPKVAAVVPVVPDAVVIGQQTTTTVESPAVEVVA
jgi:hypothetical protein